jgi:hypothetical protein
MSFFPSTYDQTENVIAALDLCAIETADGTARFIIGTDGVFTDSNSNVWYGSQLIAVNNLELAMDGNAPAGSVTLSYFQDPNATDLVDQVKSLGLDYVAGRNITFYVQPIRSQAEFYAPTIAPIQWMQRIMRTMTFSANGAQNRSISVSFESWSEDRKSARRIILNTEGHARLIGSANPSLEYMPTSDFEEEKLFG